MATWNAIFCLMAFVDFLAVLALIAVVFMYFVHIVAILYGMVKLHRLNTSLNSVNSNDYPGVTMLKPLVGEDDNLYKNLKSCFDLTYHKDELDPAVRTVKKLMEEYPNADAQLLTCATTGGVNPKINNMLQGYKMAKYDLLLINDSSLHVHPNTLIQMVSDMVANVGIVHQVPFLSNSPTFSGVIQKVYFGTQHARVYLFSNALGFTCTNGMSMLLRKHVLDEVGGLQAFSSYIAEDFFISQSFAERWTRLRITMMPVIGVLEPLTECIAVGVLGFCAIYHYWGSNAWLFFVGHCLFWFIADQLLLHILQGPTPLPAIYQLTLAWLVREILTYVIFVRGVLGREITWKNGAFRIQTGGKAYLIQGMKVEDTDHCL